MIVSHFCVWLFGFFVLLPRHNERLLDICFVHASIQVDHSNV